MNHSLSHLVGLVVNWSSNPLVNASSSFPVPVDEDGAPQTVEESAGWGTFFQILYMNVIESEPKPKGHTMSKHLNGRSEAACLSVSDSVGGEFLKVKSIEACIYIYKAGGPPNLFGSTCTM